MEKQTSVKVFEDYFERKLTAHKESLKYKNSFAEPFVTISRETGAGGIQFGDLLVDYLNKYDSKRKNDWKIFDKNILEQIVKDHDLPTEMAKYISEKRVSEMQDVIEQLFSLHPSEQMLLKKASNTILHLALLGDVILIGRGSNIITKELRGGFHLRLIDSIERKIKNIQNIFNLDKTEALKFIKKEDKERKQYLKKYFSSDIEDVSLYSIVLNLNHFSTDEAVNLVGEEVIRRRLAFIK
ncbi:MAG: cytidylate kinase-like family protein [Ignavibacteriae bacterium]|nr:cytidylate kinase-like family protein [Ignavibacteriota bacterium]